MKKILIIVEGAKDEGRLISSLFRRFQLQEPYELIALEHNISMIFDKLKVLSKDQPLEDIDFSE